MMLAREANCRKLPAALELCVLDARWPTRALRLPHHSVVLVLGSFGAMVELEAQMSVSRTSVAMKHLLSVALLVEEVVSACERGL